MPQASSTDVKEFIDSQRFSRFHWLIFSLCFFVVVMDGYDTVAIGYVAHSIADHWRVTREALGPVMSAAVIGLGIGAFLGGPLADRFGRRAVIVGATMLFGVFSGLCSVATTLDLLTVFRLLTGLGLGAAMPNSVALMSEFAPARIRSLAVNSQLMGFSAGMAIAGVGSAWLIPTFGWQGVFVAGAAGPMVLAVLLIAFLPESVQFLVLRNRNDVRVGRILSRLSPTANLSGSSFTLVSEQSHDAERNRRHVLSRIYRGGTLLLWVIYFMHLVVYYLLAGWLPTLFRDAGFSLQSASLISSIFPVGGVLGTVVIGYMMDHTNARRLVGWVYLSVAVLAVVVGQVLRLPFVLCALMFLIGALLTGGGISLSTIAAQYYGAECRGTGVSWMYAVGRLGGVFGMLAGATLTGIGWKFGSVFALLGVPSLLAGGGLLLLAKFASKVDVAVQIKPFVVEPKTD